ncbi:MAG: cysteinyl-tRNA synthetase, partial [Flaviaesturariibacter sp.]|nr:cysteinyl-tRNA synthetase [Flaviaesturariibacter sp.]
ESEIAQSTICNGISPVRYWMHNNMITLNGRKMGKSYNNVVKLTELFSGNHPLLEKAYSPMTVRFFILMTQYRSTLDFGNDALLAAEKGLKRLMEAYEWLKGVDSKQLTVDSNVVSSLSSEEDLNAKVMRLLGELDDFMNDDFNTAKVLANIFEIVPVINSLKDKMIGTADISVETFNAMKEKLQVYVEDILGLKSETAGEADKLKGVMQVLINLRKEARNRKDWVTSDAIRNQLAEQGILLKDEKGGEMSWTLVVE